MTRSFCATPVNCVALLVLDLSIFSLTILGIKSVALVVPSDDLFLFLVLLLDCDLDFDFDLVLSFLLYFLSFDLDLVLRLRRDLSDRERVLRRRLLDLEREL